MKTIIVLLASVALVAALESIYFLPLHFNAGPESPYAGDITVFQSNPTEGIRIQCASNWLSGSYIIGVHEGNGFTNDCSSLEPIQNFGPGLFHCFPGGSVNIKVYIFAHVVWNMSTMIPPNNVSGPVIALYSPRDVLNGDRRNESANNVACGRFISHGLAMPEFRRKLAALRRRRIARRLRKLTRDTSSVPSEFFYQEQRSHL